MSTKSSIRKNAFTLIELLVVISIISVLVALLLPALQAARIAANSAKCMVGQRQIAIAFEGYANDYKGAVPTATSATITNASIPNRYHGVTWPMFLAGKIQREATNNFVDAPSYISASNVGGRWQTPFLCPGNPYIRTGAGRMDYGVNYQLTHTLPTDERHALLKQSFAGFPVVESGANINHFFQYNLHRTFQPSGTLLFGDSSDQAQQVAWNRLWIMSNQISDGPWPSSALSYTRHRNVANVTYIDGHVGNMKPSTTPSWSTAAGGKLRPWYNSSRGESNLFPYQHVN